jgi:hypothetical protein
MEKFRPPGTSGTKLHSSTLKRYFAARAWLIRHFSRSQSHGLQSVGFPGGIAQIPTILGTFEIPRLVCDVENPILTKSLLYSNFGATPIL